MQKMIIAILPILVLCGCDNLEKDSKLVYDRNMNNCIWAMKYPLKEYSDVLERQGTTIQAECKFKTITKMNDMTDDQIRHDAKLIRRGKYTECDISNGDLYNGCKWGIENRNVKALHNNNL